MTKQEIYECIVRLTSELASTNVARKIFNVAQTGNSRDVENVFESFEKEHLELYLKILGFGKVFNKFVEQEHEFEIFGTEEEKDTFVFDTNVIDALSFYVLCVLGEIDEYLFFTEWEEDAEEFLNAIEEAGYRELAEYVANESWIEDIPIEASTVYELFVDIFNT